MDKAMLKGKVKTGRSHLLNTEFNALEKIGLKKSRTELHVTNVLRW